MNSRRSGSYASTWRGLLVFALVAVVAAGCASSSDADTATADAPGTEVAEATTTPTTTAATESDTDRADEAAPTTDSAAEEAIAGLDDDDGDPTGEPEAPDPSTAMQDFVLLRFNIEPEPDQVECMVARSADDEVLDAALQDPAVALGIADDPQMRALTAAMNECMDTFALAEWATFAVGPRYEVRDTAPPCIQERFDDPDIGDRTFYNFVALSYQLRLEPEGTDELVDMLTTCLPITSLSDFFAEQAEAATNFETTVDRECLLEALGPEEVSREFWDIFVSGIMPPVQFIDPFALECSSDAFADLSPSVPDDFEPWAGTGALAAVSPAARADAYSAPPPMTIDPAASYEAVIATGGGEIRVQLFADTAPVTVNNFVSLARDGYYDGTVFHRVLDGFMAQAGDPTGTGFGGPGYTFADEVDGGETFDRPGLLAMANSGADTNGSQFFITFGEPDHLNGLHTIFGEVVDGMDVVEAIERRDPDAPTSRGQLIDSITIVES